MAKKTVVPTSTDQTLNGLTQGILTAITPGALPSSTTSTKFNDQTINVTNNGHFIFQPTANNWTYDQATGHGSMTGAQWMQELNNQQGHGTIGLVQNYLVAAGLLSSKYANGTLNTYTRSAWKTLAVNSVGNPWWTANSALSQAFAHPVAFGSSSGSSGGPGTTIANETDAATLHNQFTQIARNYYLNLTPKDIAQHVQAALAAASKGETPMDMAANFTVYAQNQAKILHPALASIIGTETGYGTDNTPYTALAPWRNTIAQYTGQPSGDAVDLMSSQWSWLLAGKAPPSVTAPAGAGAAPATPANAKPQLVSNDQLQTYLMQTPQFQSTDMAKDMAWSTGNSILRAFGHG